MDFYENLATKSEHLVEETLELDFMIKIEVEAEFDQNFYTNEKLKCELNQWDPAENLYYNFIDHDNVQDSSYDGSFRRLQEFRREECNICHRVFMNRYHLIQHNSTHLKVSVDFPRMYQCDHCSVYFAEKTKLADHIYSIHNENNNISKPEKIYDCSICQKQYKYKNWHEHMTSVHGKETFECSICNVTFKCLRYLKTHNYYHHGRGYKPGEFKCNMCPKTFKYNDCLNKHVKNCHSSAVQCDICHSKLKSIVYLKTHMRRVHYNDGKTHKCDLCFKEFKSPRYVRVHKKNSHSKIGNVNRDKKVYMSCECGVSYASVRKLESHLKVCPVALKA